MAETLAELVARISVDSSELKKSLASVEKDISGLGKATDKETKSIKDNFLAIGNAATVVGVTITTAATKMIMSFSRVGSELYDLSLKTGVSVEALSGLKYAAEQNGATLGTIEMAIRRVATAMAGVADETGGAKDAFKKIGITLADLKGLNPEQQFLKIAYAIAQVPDPMTRAATAVSLFGRSGTDMLPMLSEGAAGLKRLMEQGQKASSWTSEMAKLADTLGDSFATLGTTTGGLVNEIVSSLTPVLNTITLAITSVIDNIKEWIKENPGLVKAITIATITVGLLATGIGLASLAVKYLGTVTNIYFGGMLLIIGAVVTGIVLLVDWFNRAGIASDKLADEQRTALEKQQAADKEYFASKRSEAQSATETTIANIRKEYGASKDLSKSLIDMAYDVRDAKLRAIDDEERKANQAHNDTLARIDDEYRASISQEERALQAQIDAIDKQTSAEDLAITRDEEQKRLASLTGIDYDEYAQQIARNELLRTREVEKQTLQDKIQELRDETGNVVKAYQTQRDEKIRLENESHVITLANIELERTANETLLKDTITGYERDRDAKIAAEKTKLSVVQANITLEETTLKNKYIRELGLASEFAKSLNIENGKITNVDYTITRHEVTEYSSIFRDSGKSEEPTAKEKFLEKLYIDKSTTSPTPPWGLGIEGYATGGVVSGVMGEPQLAIVHGGETIIPANESPGSVVVNISGPLFMEREDQMNQLVDKIRKGIQRQDRLRFGGAYNG